MAQDKRLRYAITPENHMKLKKIQAFAVIDGNPSPDLSALVNLAIEILIEKTIEELKNDGNKYHAMQAEMLSQSVK